MSTPSTKGSHPSFSPARLGIPERLAPVAADCIAILSKQGIQGKALRRLFRRLTDHPEKFSDHEVLGTLATMLAHHSQQAKHHSSHTPKKAIAPWHYWGDDLDPKAIQQMEDGCSLPIAVQGALMPDAHVGYGLPIGGVLAVKNAVIPYGVGMDIACRVKISVFSASPDLITTHAQTLIHALEHETRFGVGARFTQPKDHPVMHEDWSFSPVTKGMHETARAQLGTSGSGNHFVEWGILKIPDPIKGLDKGKYLALLSHSGSRGTGGEVAKYYSGLARRAHPELPRNLAHLAWLDLHTQEGQEYWAAMELMGRYSQANHILIHEAIAGHLKLTPVWSVENHHNFAWKEVHNGQEVIVHRKGATPAGVGVLGVIPGTMIDPAYVVEGLGNPLSLCSAAHGAGRRMSRQQAKKHFRRKDLDDVLRRHKVTLLAAGVDEAPMAYKDINAVMAAQSELVRTCGHFQPRIVKMAS